MKRSSRASSLGALLLVAALSATASPLTASASGPSVAVPPRNELAVVAPAGASVASLASPSPTITGTGSSRTFTVGTTSVRLSAFTGERFKVGTFQTGTAAGRLAVRITSNGATCTDGASSRVTVHDFAYEGDELTSLAATLQANCSGTGQTVAELRLNSTVGAQRAGSLPLGKSAASRRLTFTTPEATTVRDLAWAGDLSSEIRNNTCTNATLPAGGTCTVDLVVQPLETGAEYLALAIRDADFTRLDTVSVAAIGTATPDGSYTPLAKPRRFADTRATKAPLRGGVPRDFQIVGANGLPSTGISSVVLNITVVAPTVGGYLTAYPAGQAPPNASSMNYPKGWTGANLVTVRTGTGTLNGKVRLLTSAGLTNVLVDVVGYYRNPAGTSGTRGIYGSFHAFEPFRLYDSRNDSKVAGQEIFDLTADFGADNPKVKALALNVTAVAPEGSGFLTLWNGINSLDVPTVSTLNFTAGRTVPNMAIVPVGRLNNLPAFTVANGSKQRVHVIFDVVGIFDDDTIPEGSRLTALNNPKRILDTRSNQGFGKLGPNVTGTGDANAVAGSWTTSLSGNLTAVAPTRAAILTIWAAGDARPLVSAMNPAAGQVVASMVMPSLSETNRYSIYNGSAGTTNVLLDVVGTFERYRASEYAPGTGVITASAVATGVVGNGSTGEGTKTGALGADADADTDIKDATARTPGAASPKLNVR
ncbi:MULTISPECIES: hypothetical protein [unclassified Knoellia]|uniref:hypothetical protein n=1 Tax=Knoellia altitudinis TaxID=3404795 RepID=UPI0036137354